MIQVKISQSKLKEHIQQILAERFGLIAAEVEFDEKGNVFIFKKLKSLSDESITPADFLINGDIVLRFTGLLKRGYNLKDEVSRLLERMIIPESRVIHVKDVYNQLIQRVPHLTIEQVTEVLDKSDLVQKIDRSSYIILF